MVAVTRKRAYFKIWDLAGDIPRNKRRHRGLRKITLVFSKFAYRRPCFHGDLFLATTILRIESGISRQPQFRLCPMCQTTRWSSVGFFGILFARCHWRLSFGHLLMFFCVFQRSIVRQRRQRRCRMNLYHRFLSTPTCSAYLFVFPKSKCYICPFRQLFQFPPYPHSRYTYPILSI